MRAVKSGNQGMRLEFESERLIFRPLRMDDLDLEIALWTDIDVTRYITGETSTVEEIENLMPVVTQRAGGGCIGIWSLTDKSTLKHVGHTALLPLPVEAEDTEFELLQSDSWPDRDIEIGVVLRRDWWGYGIATEACTRLLEFAFSETKLDCIIATTDAQNRASQRVLLKSGMRDLGLIPAFGGDYPGFAITKAEWLIASGVKPPK